VISTTTENYFFNPNENKEFSVRLPEIKEPGSYFGIFFLTDLNTSLAVSSPFMFRIVVVGEGGKILEITPDKSSYEKGETAKMKITIAGRADSALIDLKSLESENPLFKLNNEPLNYRLSVQLINPINNNVVDQAEVSFLLANIKELPISLKVNDQLSFYRIKARLFLNERVIDEKTISSPILTNNPQILEMVKASMPQNLEKLDNFSIFLKMALGLLFLVFIAFIIVLIIVTRKMLKKSSGVFFLLIFLCLIYFMITTQISFASDCPQAGRSCPLGVYSCTGQWFRSCVNQQPCQCQCVKALYVTITANPTDIIKGQSSTITYSVSRGGSDVKCSIYEDHRVISDFHPGYDNYTKKMDVNPQQTTRYSIRCASDNSNESASASVQVYVYDVLSCNKITLDPIFPNSYVSFNSIGGKPNFSWTATGGTGYSPSNKITTSNSQIFSVKYLTPGSYLVKVNDNMSPKQSASCNVQIVSPLNISCSPDISFANQNQIITFNGSASGGTGSFTYNWSGACSTATKTGTTIDPCQTSFSSGGTKLVTLNVTSGAQTTSTNCQTTIYYNLSVTKTGSGNGTVTSSPPGINCGSTCLASYAPGTSVTLNAISDSNSIFSNWSNCDTVSGNQCIINLNTDKNVTANFNLKPPTGPSIQFDSCQYPLVPHPNFPTSGCFVKNKFVNETITLKINIKNNLSASTTLNFNFTGPNQNILENVNLPNIVLPPNTTSTYTFSIKSKLNTTPGIYDLNLQAQSNDGGEPVNIPIRIDLKKFNYQY